MVNHKGEPYVIPGLVPTDSRCLHISPDMLLEPTSLSLLVIAFFLTGQEKRFKRVLSFTAIF